MISLSDVTVALGEATILEEVSLAVDDGEFVGLVGPNGAGKTTLLRTITGVIEPDQGTVRLGDERVSDLAPRARSRLVATVPQDTHIGFSFTARQLVEMGRTPHRSRLDWSDDADPVESAMARTETSTLADQTADELSGGERQRVLLARALAQEPDALVLDEPTASLDINHQVQVLSLVRGLVDDGRCALAAIHDLDLAARYCDRLVLLSGGNITASGRPARVLEDDRLAAAFGAETTVSRDHVTGSARVTAVTGRPTREVRVHVSGSGYGATRAVRTLWRAGYEVSVGPAPEGDIVVDLASQFNLETVTARAFEGPTDRESAAARRLVRRAAVHVITEGAGSDVNGYRAGSEVCGQPRVTPRVEASLGGPGPASALGDGGDGTVRTPTALLEAVTSRRS